MSSEPILSIEGNQATIRLNRPQHHNRIEGGDIAVLHDMFSEIERDTRVRVLVLTASGTTFSAGYDLQALAIEVSENRVPAFDKMVDQLELLRVPTICSLNGSAYGGGTDLALACDFRIGVDGMEILMPAASIGIHYYYSGLRRCVQRLGVDAAKRIFLCAEKIGGDDLLRIGFVNWIVPIEELGKRTDALAGTLAQNSPAAVQSIKRALNEINSGSCNPEVIERAWTSSLRSKDVVEGLAAQAAKRKPVFRDS
jgi:enoyl-CoA hydratase/carnithine racemase